MITVMLGIFIIAALLGIVLLTYVLTNKETPKGLAIIHGLFAALGLITLIILAIESKSKVYINFFCLFVVVALVGFYLFYKDLTNKIPKAVALIHGLAAMTGIVLLFYMFIK